MDKREKDIFDAIARVGSFILQDNGYVDGLVTRMSEFSNDKQEFKVFRDGEYALIYRIKNKKHAAKFETELLVRKTQYYKTILQLQKQMELVDEVLEEEVYSKGYESVIED